MGLWRALAEVFPTARHQRCWVHKARKVTHSLPKSARPGATNPMQEICNAEDRDHAQKAIEVFAKTYGPKFPGAVAEISDDAGELPAFYDFRAEHWIHLRRQIPSSPTSPRSNSAPRSPAALAVPPPPWRWSSSWSSPPERWRAITGRPPSRFENGVLVEREDAAAA